MVYFICGLFVGAVVGVFFAALISAADDDDVRKGHP